MMTGAALDDNLVSAMIDPIVLAPTVAAQIQKEIENLTPSCASRADWRGVTADNRVDAL